MTNRQEAKLNMYNAVVSHGDDNTAIIATVPAYQTAFNSLKTKVSALLSTSQLEAQVITGITMDKAQAKKTLAQQAADIASVVYAFASNANDNTLKEAVHFSVSDLLRMKDELVGPTCQNIRNAANTNLASLANYGITAATITLFDATIANYTTAVPTPRNAVSQRQAYKTSIESQIKEIDSMLKSQLDKVAVQFKSSNINFYNTYKNNRVILDPGSSTTQLIGTVISKENGAPLDSVAIADSNNKYITSTNNTGGYTLKIAVPGTYKIIFTKSGYQTREEKVQLTLGQTTTLNMVLLPA